MLVGRLNGKLFGIEIGKLGILICGKFGILMGCAGLGKEGICELGNGGNAVGWGREVEGGNGGIVVVGSGGNVVVTGGVIAGVDWRRWRLAERPVKKLVNVNAMTRDDNQWAILGIRFLSCHLRGLIVSDDGDILWKSLCVFIEESGFRGLMRKLVWRSLLLLQLIKITCSKP